MAPPYGKIPARMARLRLPGREHAVLDAIANHTNKGTGLAHVGLETIARETRLHKRKVPARVLWLVEHGVLEIVEHGGRGVGGRGRANVYRIISDEEALRRAAQLAAATDDAIEAVAPNCALPGTEAATENGALFGSETVPFSAPNGALPGTPTERTESRTGDPVSEELRVGGAQTHLLLPIRGGMVRATSEQQGNKQEEDASRAGSAEPSSERKRELFLHAVLQEAARTLPPERYAAYVEAMWEPDPPRWAREERERLARQMRGRRRVGLTLTA